MNDLISVIVPCYNVERYLSACLDSIIDQTYENLEILVINDGSKDNTQSIIDDYASKDNRIRKFYQENQGLSAARNTGIDNAKGDYYVFIDSDDDVLPTMIEELYVMLKKHNADIAICNFEKIESESSFVSFEQVKKERQWSFSNDTKYDQIYDYYVPTVVQWNKLFKKEIFSDIRYPVGIMHEDEYVIHRELFNAKKIVYTNRKLYRYYSRTSSITKINDCIRTYHASLGFNDRISFFRQECLYDKSLRALENFQWYISYVKEINKDSKNYDKYILMCEDLLANNLEIHKYLNDKNLELPKHNLINNFKRQFPVLTEKLYSYKCYLTDIFKRYNNE